MTATERRAAYSLAGIFSLRMLGLFMILPVFALYAQRLHGATPLLIGLAIGAYGLTQALLQIPFGMLSDRYGRKVIIALGLLIFAAGSVVAAVSDTITGVIIGRALQGSGAIAAAVMALAADLTREEHRLKAMAVIGMTIGMSFAVALVAGPLLNTWIGVPGIFWLTAVLALGGIAALFFWVPRPSQQRFHRDTEPVPAQFKNVLGNTQLLRLNFGIFVLHMVLTASFVALPTALRDQAGLGVQQHWLVYLGVLLVSIAAMIPLVIIAEKGRRLKQIFVAAILLVTVSQLGLSLLYSSLWGIVVALIVFFLAFNVLEASLPSLVAKMAPADKKGTAMGLYSSSQFFGAFMGGAVGGSLLGAFGEQGVFVFCAVVGAIWAMVGASMSQPSYLSSYMVNVGRVDSREAQDISVRMAQVPGVAEVVVVAEEGVAYLKVDRHNLDSEALGEFSISEA